MNKSRVSTKLKLPAGAVSDKDIRNAKNMKDLKAAALAGSAVGLLSKPKKKKKVVKKRSK